MVFQKSHLHHCSWCSLDIFTITSKLLTSEQKWSPKFLSLFTITFTTWIRIESWIDIFHACDSSIITFLELLLVYAVNSLSPSCNSSFFSDSLKIFSKNFFVSSGMMSSLDLDIVRRELRTELYSWRTLEVFLRNFPFDFGEFPPDPFPEHSWLQGQF